MINELTITGTQNNPNNSDYFWMNIDLGDVRVGKVRSKKEADQLTIYSINIFPEYERRGIARNAIQSFKHDYKRIVADRVRYTAIDFWEKMGFSKQPDGNYLWKKIIKKGPLK